MVKPKSKANYKRKTKVDVSDTEEYADAVDPSATEFIYDAVDEYYENEEREGAEKLAKLMKKNKRITQVNKFDILFVLPFKMLLMMCYFMHVKYRRKF